MGPISESLGAGRRRGSVLLLFVLLALTAVASSPARALAKPDTRRIFKPEALRDLEDIAAVLKQSVAHLRIEVERSPNEPFRDPERDGFAIVLDKNRVAALSFLVEDAKRVVVEGPSGVGLDGKVILYDIERRVAFIETKAPLGRVGLTPAETAPLDSRRVGDDVFALISIGPDATVLHGVLLYVGNDPEYGGHHRVDLKLSHGMPVFDARARFVGFSRFVAWDVDPLMLVTPEMISAARTATGAASTTPPKTEDHPRWSR